MLDSEINTELLTIATGTAKCSSQALLSGHKFVGAQFRRRLDYGLSTVNTTGKAAGLLLKHTIVLSKTAAVALHRFESLARPLQSFSSILVGSIRKRFAIPLTLACF